jgi:hypothetical protein
MQKRFQRLLGWLTGLRENPFVVCQRQAEARRSPLKRLVYGYGLYGAMLTIPLLLGVSAANNFHLGQVSSTVQVIVVMLAFAQILYVALKAIVQTSASVVNERQRGTLLSLALTQVNSADYADGLVAAGVRPVIREITMLAPAAAFIGWFAGADLFSMFMLWAISVLMAVIFGYVGVWISAGARNTQQATQRATAQTVFLILISPILMVFAGFWAFPVWIVHPFVALSLAFWGKPELAQPDAFSYMVVRWWALLAIPLYFWIASSCRRKAIRALERTHLI